MIGSMVLWGSLLVILAIYLTADSTIRGTWKRNDRILVILSIVVGSLNVIGGFYV